MTQTVKMERRVWFSFELIIQEYNDRNEEKQEELEERISYLEEETTSNYDHILELSKEEVEGD